jgi:hypothetical protein
MFYDHSFIIFKQGNFLFKKQLFSKHVYLIFSWKNIFRINKKVIDGNFFFLQK